MIDQSKEDAIRARAYDLWEKAGKIPGQHEEHWRQAEQELQGSSSASAMPSQQADGMSQSQTQSDGSTDLHRVPEPGPRA